MSDEDTGIKNIVIHATTRYPVVSAYEYEFLKVEKEIQDRMDGCTIYFIMQRPLIWFNDTRTVEDGLTFEITDGRQKPLLCHLSFFENGILKPGESLLLDYLFYKNVPTTMPPHDDVAGFRLYHEDETFIVWYSPQKLLYDVLVHGFKVTIDGDVSKFLDYTVHYIGKSFSQPVWDRLTGHHKMQRILTMEGAISSNPLARAPFEIALLMLEVEGYDEVVLGGYCDFAVPEGVEPIVHYFDLDNDGGASFFRNPLLKPKAPELTAEIEAMLINRFKPSYNSILYENYPRISNGTRSAGYTHSTLAVGRLPVILKSASYSMEQTGD
jgi:hypothetical protein